MLPMFRLGCTGEFGCDCPNLRAGYNGHGTRARYQKGCRCKDCTAANTEATKKYRERYAAATEG